MARATSVIQINGNNYDAVTGNVIGSAKRIAQHLDHSSNRVIDGFIRKATYKPKSAAVKSEAKSETVEKVRPAHEVKSSAKKVHHRTERSHTLMRSAVSKPGAHLKAAKERAFTRPTPHDIPEISAKRESRAKSVVKHAKVERFGIPRPRRTENNQPQTGEIISPTNGAGAKSASANTAAPASLIASASHQRLERMLDEVLTQASSHKETLRRHSKNPLKRLAIPAWLSILIISAILLAVAFFFVWRNVPQVAIRVAGARAHVNASAPAYTPAGFTFQGPINYSDNSVTAQYKDKTNAAQNFSITQTKSSQTSTSVAANYIDKGTPVQTAEVQGTTVYIYGDKANATWVNNGTKYQITNEANLSSDQILRIVQSL